MAKNYSDSDILKAIRNGKDNEAVSFFYNDFWPQIRAHICSRGGTIEDAEEVYHHAILKFFERVKGNGYEAGKSNGIRGYIYTICKNRWIDTVKKRKMELSISDDNQEEYSSEFADNPLSSETRDFIKELFARLGERCENVLDYFIYHGFSIREIAGKMRFESENAVKMQKHRCVKKLIGLMKREPGTEKVVLELLKA